MGRWKGKLGKPIQKIMRAFWSDNSSECNLVEDEKSDKEEEGDREEEFVEEKNVEKESDEDELHDNEKVEDDLLEEEEGNNEEEEKEEDDEEGDDSEVGASRPRRSWEKDAGIYENAWVGGFCYLAAVKIMVGSGRGYQVKQGCHHR
jgi:hypothetical protein